MPLIGQDNITKLNLQKIAERAVNACFPVDTSAASKSSEISIVDGTKPKAIVVISAHWEASPVRITSSTSPSMLFDYYGFPAEAYTYSYDASGHPELAQRIQSLLKDRNIPSELDDKRGYDHGVFVPLMLAYPEADVPVVAVSLHSSLDPQLHINIGKALQPLRDEGVLILGSGMSYHNMAGFKRNGGSVLGKRFDQALAQVITNPKVAEREEALKKWDKVLVDARECHPREEHLMPLLVCAGAAGNDIGRQVDNSVVLGAQVSDYSFP